MTDISKIVAAERAIEITHPSTGINIGLSITLLPDTDPAVRAAERKMLNDRLLDKAKPTAEKIEAQVVDTVVSRVSAWTWKDGLNFHGDKPKCTPDKVRQVLIELPWVREQIEQEVRDRALFFRGTDE